jgi:hypothetical protein
MWTAKIDNSFHQIKAIPDQLHAYGKGLTEHCLSFNETLNKGLPYTMLVFATATLVTYSTAVFQTFNNASTDN